MPSWRHRCSGPVDADAIVGEDNFGSDMAKQIIVQVWTKLVAGGQTKGRLMPAIIEVTAKKGKRLRAEPIARLYAQGLVHHVGGTRGWRGSSSRGSRAWTPPTAWTPACTP
ncbi:hypothetical protein [Streptomyces sp. NPDC004266]|uniref:hypothetical protein n=1 Tax=Streptomyces sp. NPDC004266 TaxID=3364693 RepID=UPI003697BD5E